MPDDTRRRSIDFRSEPPLTAQEILLAGAMVAVFMGLLMSIG